MKVIKLESKKDLLYKMINLAILLKLPKEYELREREKEFLVNTIMLSNQGFTLESKEMVVNICEMMKIKRDDVYNYRNILKNKKWLIQTVDGLDLLSALDFSDRDIPEHLEIKYKLTVG